MSVSGKTAVEIRDAIRAGDLSSRQATREVLDAIGRRDAEVGAYISRTDERAMADAEAVDERIARGETVGPLAGVPVAIKDNFCTKDGTTTCGSKILENYHAPYDAHVVERLRDAGAVIVGKTNLDEFAMGSSTENSAARVTRNPWDLARVPGGSSGGSAAAVAAGMCVAALGSDTGGSIRLPASFCGVTGLKPSYGRVSRYGLVAYGSSLDQIGPLTRTVADAALLLGAIAGRDERDSTSVDAPVPDYLGELAGPIAGTRIGIAREFFGEGLDPRVERAVRDALAQYEEMGAEIVELSLPTTPYWLAAYTIVAFAEASSNLSRYDGVHYGLRTSESAGPDENALVHLYSDTRRLGFGPEVKRRIVLGTYALSSGYYDAYYLKALKVRRLIKNDFDAAFEECDVLAGPVAPTPAFRVGEKTQDPLTMYLTDIYTISANLAGICGISIPAGLADDKLPIGLQLLAPPFEEPRLLRVAHAFQEATDWHRRRPPICSNKDA